MLDDYPEYIIKDRIGNVNKPKSFFFLVVFLIEKDIFLFLKKKQNGEKLYLVKWVGFDETDNTWEQEGKLLR